jgi:ABC-type arginine transport system ATPase subunit
MIALTTLSHHTNTSQALLVQRIALTCQQGGAFVLEDANGAGIGVLQVLVMLIQTNKVGVAIICPKEDVLGRQDAITMK